MTDKEITLKNLQRVYDELPELAKTIPSIIEEFDMQIYGIYDNLTKDQIKNNQCQTIGNGLGNCALLFGVDQSDFSSERFSFYKFAIRIFPYLLRISLDQGWSFLFHENWAHVQPTFHQFIERVKYYIDCNGELGQWKFQEESFIKNPQP